MQKNHPGMHGFSLDKIRDNHAHLAFEKPIEETVTCFKNILDFFNYEAMNVLALPSYSITENYKALYCKSRLAPHIFASAGIEHYLDARDTKEYYTNLIRKYHAMGFDGIKILEGKITTYRDVKMQINDRRFDGFYQYAEEHRLPIVMHLGDPAHFWDPSKATPYAISRGWVYTEDEPSLEMLRSWVDDILARFPKLTLILAHFYFMGDELTRAAKLLDTYDNVHFDLTPGGEMFVGFSKNPMEARAFFEKYQNRLLYGSDMYNAFDSPEKADAEMAGPRVFQVRSCIEKTEGFMAPNLSDEPLHAFGFSKEIHSKIYRENMIRLYGFQPRQLDVERIVSALYRIREERKLNEAETENMKTMIAYFESCRNN